MPRKRPDEANVQIKGKEKLGILLNDHVCKKQQLEYLILEEALLIRRLQAIDDVADKRKCLSTATKSSSSVDSLTEPESNESTLWNFQPYVDYNVRIADLQDSFPVNVEPSPAVAFFTRTIIESLCLGPMTEKQIKQ